MADATEASLVREQPSHDQSGVDRTLIRQMLALTPLERLRRLEEFVESVLFIRDLNEKRSLR